jgi:hypothetical protein
MPDKNNTSPLAREVLLSAEEAKQARELIRQIQQGCAKFSKDLKTIEDPDNVVLFQETIRQLMQSESAQQGLKALFDPGFGGRLQESINRSLQFEPAFPRLPDFVRQHKSPKHRKRRKHAQPRQDVCRIVYGRLFPGRRIPSRKELPDSELIATAEAEFQKDPDLRKSRLGMPSHKSWLRAAGRLKR